MKIVIDIDNKELERVIDIQVGKEVAKITSESITKQVEQIIPLKFGRFSDKDIQTIIEEKAKQLIQQTYSTYELQRKLDNALLLAAKELLKK